MSRKEPTPVPAGAIKPEPPPPPPPPPPVTAADQRVLAERQRVLAEIEWAIYAWSYPGEVAENVVCCLMNIGIAVANGGDGGVSAEAAAWHARVEAESAARFDAAETEERAQMTGASEVTA